MKKAINLAAGDKHFESNEQIEWINCDLSDRDGKMELIHDITEPLPFPDETFDIIVASHCVEHIEMAIVKDVLADWMRCLKKGGQMIITVPDVRAMAERYVVHDMIHYLFLVNMTGPFHGSSADYHRWGYDWDELTDRLNGFSYHVLTRDNLPKELQDGKIALDWWILSCLVEHKI
jgi:predicted SAM-dependent methyltransferase